AWDLYARTQSMVPVGGTTCKSRLLKILCSAWIGVSVHIGSDVRRYSGVSIVIFVHDDTKWISVDRIDKGIIRIGYNRSNRMRGNLFRHFPGFGFTHIRYTYSQPQFEGIGQFKPLQGIATIDHISFGRKILILSFGQRGDGMVQLFEQ